MSNNLFFPENRAVYEILRNYTLEQKTTVLGGSNMTGTDFFKP